MSSRILLAAHGRAIEATLTEELSRSAADRQVDLSSLPEDTRSRVAGGTYAAVVCWADRTEDLEEVRRIRLANPELPILLVSSEKESKFRSDALLAGATSLVPSLEDQVVLAEHLGFALKMNQASQVLNSLASKAKELTRDIRDLVQSQQELLETTLHRSQAPRRSRLLPLLVEDEPDHAFRLVRAFESAELLAPLSILRSAAEAIQYLEGRAPYSDRNRHPLPNIVLVDLHASPAAGLELLGWIRSQSRFKRVPVIILADSIDSESVRLAYSLHANSYLLTPANFGELVEMVRAIDQYWSTINVGQELR